MLRRGQADVPPDALPGSRGGTGRGRGARDVVPAGTIREARHARRRGGGAVELDQTLRQSGEDAGR